MGCGDETAGIARCHLVLSHAHHGDERPEGREKVTLTNLAPPNTGCLHDYVLTPDNMRKLEKADVFVANGAGAESFLLTVAKSIRV